MGGIRYLQAPTNPRALPPCALSKVKTTKSPALRTIESAASRIGSFLAPKRSPAPLLPRSGVFQWDDKKPYVKSVVVMYFAVR
ncbi:hypothetical protein CSQ88_06390 [Iodobacter sp. BJB302]|nr:hypothetical protein CSQ88_06390 [Iodobacter sp. BJB302]